MKINNINQKEFGKFIANRRKELCLLQKDIAIFLNVTTQTIYKYEHGLSFPDTAILGDIAFILKVSIDDLLSLNNVTTEYERKPFIIDDFANAIRKLRKVNGYSLADLQDKINVKYQTISKWEKQTSLPLLNQLIDLANLYGISISSLYYGKITVSKSNKPNKLKTHKRFSFIFILLLVCFISSIVTLLVTSNKEITISYNMGDDNIHYEIISRNEKVPYYKYNKEGYYLSYYTYNGEIFDFNKKVNKNITLEAVYSKKEYMVYFFNEDGSYMKSEAVLYLESATPPRYDDSKYMWTGGDYTCIKKETYLYLTSLDLLVTTPLQVNYEIGVPITSLPTFYTKHQYISGWMLNGEKVELPITITEGMEVNFTPIYEDTPFNFITNGKNEVTIVSNDVKKEDIVIPDEINAMKVTKIESLGNEYTKSIVIGKNIKEIGDLAFDKCSNIKKIDLSASSDIKLSGYLFTNNHCLQEIRLSNIRGVYENGFHSFYISNTYYDYDVYLCGDIESYTSSNIIYCNNLYIDCNTTRNLRFQVSSYSITFNKSPNITIDYYNNQGLTRTIYIADNSIINYLSIYNNSALPLSIYVGSNISITTNFFEGYTGNSTYINDIFFKDSKEIAKTYQKYFLDLKNENNVSFHYID